MNNTRYPINEIFATLQGEASFSGTPSIFIRLQGCEVGCPWCDTKHTWELDPKMYNENFITIKNKEQDKNSWTYATTEEIIEYIQNDFPHITHIVITGGEPAKYNLAPLCNQLEQLGKKIQIETSGTEKLQVTPLTWVTLSPKINMPGGKTLFEESIKRANEIKMPIGKMADIENLKIFLNKYSISKHIQIWLQPLSQNNSATKLCIEQAIQNNWNLSIQAHKYLNIR